MNASRLSMRGFKAVGSAQGPVPMKRYGKKERRLWHQLIKTGKIPVARLMRMKDLMNIANLCLTLIPPPRVSLKVNVIVEGDGNWIGQTWLQRCYNEVGITEPNASFPLFSHFFQCIYCQNIDTYSRSYLAGAVVAYSRPKLYYYFIGQYSNANFIGH